MAEGGHKKSDLLSTIQASINFHNLKELNLRSLKTYRFQIKFGNFPNFKAQFSVV